MNEYVASTQELLNSWSWSHENSDDMHHDSKLKDEDLISTYLEKRVADLVKAHVALHSEQIIDLAIKAYVLSESNRKREEKYKLLHEKKNCLGKSRK